MGCQRDPWWYSFRRFTGSEIPVEKTRLRYGNGKTEATNEIALGDYTLTIQFADGLHRAFRQDDGARQYKKASFDR